MTFWRLCFCKSRLSEGKVDPLQWPSCSVFWVPSCFGALYEFQKSLIKCLLRRISSKQSYCFTFNETIFYAWWGGQEAKCVNWKVSVGLYWVLMPQMESWTNLRSPFTKRENGKKVQWCFDVRGTRANHDAPFDSNTFLRTFIRAKWQTRLRRNEYLRLWDCGDGGISGNAVSILCLSIDWLAILTAAKTKSIFILVRNSNMHGDSYYGVLFNFIPPWQIRC